MVSLGRVVRPLLDRSTCLQEERQNNIKIEMKRGETEHRGRIKVRGREVRMKEWEWGWARRGDRLGARKSSIIFIISIITFIFRQIHCSGNKRKG